MKLCYKTNEYATHQPVIIGAINQLNKNSNILELGCGEGSTELLHILSKGDHYIYTIDHTYDWLNKYKDKFSTSYHDFKCLGFDEILKDEKIINTNWDFVFIDQGDWNSREECINYFKDKVKFIVVHDSDIYSNGRIGIKVESLIPFEKEGISDFSLSFKYFKEYWPPSPWPAPTGPPTLIASNFVPCDFELDFLIEEI